MIAPGRVADVHPRARRRDFYEFSADAQGAAAARSLHGDRAPFLDGRVARSQYQVRDGFVEFSAAGGGDKYQLFALNLSDGTLLSGYPRDIGQPDPVYQIQRAALGLAPNGLMVYVAFGGWSGDCRPYHPYVVAVPVGANLGHADNLHADR